MKKLVLFCIFVVLIPVFAFSQIAYTIDAALGNSIFYLNGKIPPKSRVAVLNFTSEYPKLSDYVIEELIGYIVNDNVLTVVDRANLDKISKEMNFQLSGEVSDETALSIGKKLGAQIIILGAITPVGNTYRLRIKAISLESSQILGMQNVDVAQDRRIGALTGTGYIEASVTAPSNSAPSGNLALWTFSDELGKMIKSNYYKPPYKGINVAVSESDYAQIQQKLDTALFSGKGAPDVIALEDQFVRKYVESGFLLDITDIYEANKQKLMAYPVEVGSYNGRVFALSWQATPGAMFYRRSLAKKYLGTDDPKVVQTYFANINKFLETAKLLKEKSKDTCLVISCYDSLFDPFLYSRKNPWVIDRKLIIDPVIEQYMDFCRTMIDNHYTEGSAWQWGDGWFAGMRGELKNDAGKPMEVFSYFLPTWGLHHVLKTNAPKTSGDWAMIPGPLTYRAGGTWLAAWRDTPNPAAAKELIRYLTTDDQFLEAYAKATGDLVSNINVVNKISNNFKESFLKNQNHYMEFSQLAQKVNGKLTTGYDERVKHYFSEELSAFMFGGKSKEKALADFRANVEYNLLRGK
ncbi:MAG: extracellular solute-binding protein [Treponema sp.]|jgi:ABC-type glycerol-3-phosphate transport system substrate-binding protein|nr:extracellular solute-binding protein [Treponema sp.]